MRRIAIVFVCLVAAGTFIVLAGGAGSGSGGSTYYAELDNAFGLVKGGDMKVAGVRAGKITDLILCTKTEKKCLPAARGTNLALVGFKITQNGFGSLRTDTTCQSRPQSLIGEYYLDCEPGTNPQVLKGGSTIAVTTTASTIPPDLIGDILREPYRERFSIILGELGAAAAGNGQNLNDAIRRAVPALRETDQVLRILARQNTILADLASQSDIVLKDLADNRTNVQRWIVASKGAAADSAAQKANIERGFALLPTFLSELRPAMAALGQVIDTNTPVLQNLNSSATQLKTLFNNLGPFATASTPSVQALGKASVTGNQAAQAATGTVQQLNQFASGTPELAQNLSIILQHLDNPAYGVTRDPRAVAQHPTTHSNTYTGLEALLQYVFDQASDTNYFTADGHLLGVGVFSRPKCDPYANAATAKALLATNPECHTWLGPTQPGITTPDPTKLVTPAKPASARGRSNTQTTVNPQANTAPTSAPQTSTNTSGNAGGGSKGAGTCLLGVCVPTNPVTTPAPVTNVPAAVGQAVSGLTNAAQGATGNATGATQGATQNSGSGGNRNNGSLLGYLLGP